MVRAGISRDQQCRLRTTGAPDAAIVNTRLRIASVSVALFALNAAICWRLFGIEYLDDFQSNEGSWITFATFLRQYWPHVSWFPWFDAGMPFENTYLPGVSGIVALFSLIGRCSPAHAFHFVAALTYSLGPVTLFLFAHAVSMRIVPSAWVAALWSVLSPSIMFPSFLHEMGTPFGIRRLRDIVYWGDTPHNVAICLLPISLLLIWRFLDQPTARRFALAALAAGAVMLTNAFGIVVVFISSLILLATRPFSWKALASLCGIQLTAYLLICRFLPPSLVRLLETNSQFVGGDFRFTLRTVALAGCFVAIVIALWALTRRLSNPILQFAILFSACFGGITFLGFQEINLIPQPLRYHLELEPGLCLLAVFLLESLRIPWKPVLGVAIVPLAWLAIKDRQFARDLIHPADIARSLPFREAQWVSENLPGERVLVSSEAEFLFSLFAQNPQMSAGHEPSTPNWVQHVAVYTIETGQNAGAQDAEISILWLKAFGCGAIMVPGYNSKDHYHGITDPDKFDGLLPRVWQESGDSIYKIPKRSPSLAHVIPKSSIVRTRPSNGLDVAELRRYVDALESKKIPDIVWEHPGHARISAVMGPSEALSVQINYDPGWEARIGNRKVTIRADQLGLILIEPDCIDCSIDLEFTGGWERKVASGVSLLAGLMLIGMLSVSNKSLRTSFTFS
jgi:hypothetical protein